VAERHLRAEQTEAVDILHRRAAAAPAGVFLLVGRLQQVHVQRHAVFARAIGEPSQRLVGAPMEIGWSELHLDPARIPVAAVKPFEQRDVVIERQLKTLEPSLHRAAQLGRQAGDEVLVPLVDQPVLVAHRVRVGNSHPDILVGADRLLATAIHLIQFSGDTAVQMLDRRDTRRDHLERRIKRVEVKVDVPHHHAGDEPQFERHVRRAELHRRQSDVVVSVD
jgi:hypothetical protein